MVWWSSTGASQACGLPWLHVLPSSSDHCSSEQPTSRSSLKMRLVSGSMYIIGSSVAGGKDSPAMAGDTFFQVLLPSYDAQIVDRASPTALSKSAATMKALPCFVTPIVGSSALCPTCVADSTSGFVSRIGLLAASSAS